ncbi:MAG TPA: 50S ribosomal protein L18 [Gemmatimonadales bacterium]|nr:50S ribosomal protein L18 [Gemmatimonadales bacterium]
MRKIHKIRTQAHRRLRRHLRVRRKVAGSAERPRLVVFRSSKHIYAQVVDDVRGVTLLGAGDTSEGIQVDGKGKTARSFALGRLIAVKAKEKGIGKVVFDRGGYQYHGRVRAVAEGARKGGLEL